MAYTEQQLKDAARKALAAGDNAAAKRLIDAARAAGAAVQPPAQPSGAAGRIAAAKAGTLTVSPESAASAAAADEAAMAQMQPAPGIMDYLASGLTVSEPAKALGAGIVRGGAQLVGLPGTAGDLIDAALKRAGILREDAPGSLLSGESLQRSLADVTGGATEFRGEQPVSQYAGTVGEMIGGGAGARLGTAAGVASEAAGQATEGTAVEPYARLVGALAGGLAYQGAEGLVNAVTRNKSIRAFIDRTPAVDELKSRAGDLYNSARQNGVIAAPAQVNQLGDDLMTTLRGEGVITPKGTMAGSYPRVSDAIKLIDDYRGAPMTPTEMLQVRKAFQAAAQSADPVEARLGTIMIRQFDDFTSPLAPQIAEANQIYRRAMQGDLIETTVELAGSRAGQFSGSGFENALRTEFRALERKIIKGQLRVTPDEEDLIRRIAQGGTMENIARDIGKAAPRGVVSAGMAGGVPFAIGTTIGGPALGATMGLGALGAGEIGRRAATAMQTRNASLLDALARSGGVLPQELQRQSANVPSVMRAIPGLLAQ